MIVTPFSVTTDLARPGAGDVAALRGGHVDDDAARLHDATSAAVISFGAGRPGISAVVMMMSTSAACSE